jgi:hypothetical protein
MITMDSLRAEVEPYKNTLVLDCFDVVRLVGIAEDQSDFYYVYERFRQGIVWSSAVGGWTPLKGIIPENEYKRLVYIWNLNNDKEAAI